MMNDSWTRLKVGSGSVTIYLPMRNWGRPHLN